MSRISHRLIIAFSTFHWSAVEKGGPAVARRLERGRRRAAHRGSSASPTQGFRTRFYCLNGHTGTLLSGYQFPSDEAARIRWRAAVVAGVDWVATDEYPAIAEVLKEGTPPRAPEVRVVDLNIGEPAKVVLTDGTTVDVRVDGTAVEHDSIRGAVRKDVVRVTINGEHVSIPSGQYELPRAVGSVQVDCPVTAPYLPELDGRPLEPEKAVRLRFWVAGRPWIAPGNVRLSRPPAAGSPT